MGVTRRAAIVNLTVSAALAARQQEPDRPRIPAPPNPDEDIKLPNGKSQKDAIAKEDHDAAMRDVNELITVAEQLRDELQKLGEHVVSVSSVKKTEEIERLAKKIRGRLKS
jgi:hypothetical protein